MSIGVLKALCETHRWRWGRPRASECDFFSFLFRGKNNFSSICKVGADRDFVPSFEPFFLLLTHGDGGGKSSRSDIVCC